MSFDNETKKLLKESYKLKRGVEAHAKKIAKTIDKLETAILNEKITDSSWQHNDERCWKAIDALNSIKL